jgi:hypothetical protein
MFNSKTTAPKPSGSKLFPDYKPEETQLAHSYSVVKICIPIAQLILAIVTLYQFHGDQIQRFKYATFGLTVAPYAWISPLNLVGSLICPQYPTMYVVESTDVDDLRDRISLAGGQGEAAISDKCAHFGVQGTVGRIRLSDESLFVDHNPLGTVESWLPIKLLGRIWLS